MHQLTLLGLGPGHMDYLTMEAYQVLKSSPQVWIRTEKHPIIDPLKAQGVNFISYDSLYDTAEEFEQVYRQIVADVLLNLENQDVVYAVPGNPFVAEKTVQWLTEALPKDQIRVIHGTSFLDAIVTRLQLDPVLGLRVVDCLRLEEASHANDDALVCIQCYNTIVASDLKIWLTGLYQDDHPVMVVRAVGIPEMEEIITMPLYELDRYAQFDHLTSVVVPQHDGTKRWSFDDLVRIMRLLRSEKGCPWDREQNHESLLPYVLEEAYEVAQAIRRGDVFELEEELGDLLLQIVFHAQIGTENGDFSMADVLDAICTKMISRHPHVFSDVLASTSEEVLVNWEAIKQTENNHKTVSDSIKKLSSDLPALFRSEKIQKKAAKVGFDWPDAMPVFDKITEEIEELKEAIAAKNGSGIEEELGDLLFTLVNLARKLGVDSEFALHQSADKFTDRFAIVEAEMADKHLNMSDIPLEELENAWQRAKKVKILINN